MKKTGLQWKKVIEHWSGSFQTQEVKSLIISELRFSYRQDFFTSSPSGMLCLKKKKHWHGLFYQLSLWVAGDSRGASKYCDNEIKNVPSVLVREGMKCILVCWRFTLQRGEEVQNIQHSFYWFGFFWVQWLFLPFWHSQTKQTHKNNWEQTKYSFLIISVAQSSSYDRQNSNSRTWSTQHNINTQQTRKNFPKLELILLKFCVVYKMKQLFTFNLNNYHFKKKNKHNDDINKNKHWLFPLVIKYIILIIIRRFHYVLSSAINKDAQSGCWGSSPTGFSVRVALFKVQLRESGGGQKLKVTKFSQTCTSETQPKWLVQKSGSRREGSDSSASLPQLHQEDNIGIQHEYCSFSLLACRWSLGHSDPGQPVQTNGTSRYSR